MGTRRAIGADTGSLCCTACCDTPANRSSRNHGALARELESGPPLNRRMVSTRATRSSRPGSTSFTLPEAGRVETTALFSGNWGRVRHSTAGWFRHGPLVPRDPAQPASPFPKPVESKPRCPCPGTGVRSATQPPDGFDTGRSSLTARLNQLQGRVPATRLNQLQGRKLATRLNQLRGRKLATRLNQLRGRGLATRLNRLQGMNSSTSFWEGAPP